ILLPLPHSSTRSLPDALPILATSIAPIPLSSFAGQPSSSIGVAFLKSYAAICLEGCIIVLACVIFSQFASAPPAVGDASTAPARSEEHTSELQSRFDIVCRLL